MDFFTGKKPTNPGEEDQQSGTDLFSSAKVLAEAAQSSFNKKDDTAAVDKAKVAEAADDLLEAASRYGKLEEKGYGQYVEKAEGYLHQYNKTAPAADQGKAPPPAAEAKADETVETPPPAKAEETAERPPPPAKAEEKEDGDEKSGGGFGGAFKMAQGFLGK